jgi:hypothetical protein
MQVVEGLLTLGVLAIIFGFPLAMTRLRQKGRERAVLDEAQRDEMVARLVHLEERVRVLERIVTDGQADLRSQFRNL